MRSDAAGPLLDRILAGWKGWMGLGLALLAGLDLLQPREGSRALGLFGYLLIAVVFAMAVAVVARRRPPLVTRLLESAPLVHLGRHSYFIYLWHGLLGGILIRWIGGRDFVLNAWGGLGLVVLAVGLTWAAAAASWRWFEGPIVRWGHRHAY